MARPATARGMCDVNSHDCRWQSSQARTDPMARVAPVVSVTAKVCT